MMNLINELNKANIPLIFINYYEYEDIESLNCGILKFVFREENKMDIRKVFKKLGFQKKDFAFGTLNGYRMLYQTKEPEVYVLNNIIVEFWLSLCCQSYYQHCWIPLDKAINNQIWDCCIDADKSVHLLSIDDSVLYCIIDSVFNRKLFNASSKKYLINNSEVLKEESMKYKLSKEFFAFTNMLISLIDERNFDCIFNYFNSFTNY